MRVRNDLFGLVGRDAVPGQVPCVLLIPIKLTRVLLQPHIVATLLLRTGASNAPCQTRDPIAAHTPEARRSASTSLSDACRIFACAFSIS